MHSGCIIDGMSSEQPAGLGPRGANLWASFAEKYDCSPAEAELFVEACRTLDLLDMHEQQLAAQGLVVKGSQGQPVLNGVVLIGEG
jgi:hypothetical protein